MFTSPRHRVLEYKLYKRTQTRETNGLHISEVRDVAVLGTFRCLTTPVTCKEKYHCSLELDPVAV